MECEKCQILLYDYIYDLLDINSHEKIEKHLKECPQCQEEWQACLKALSFYKKQMYSLALNEDFTRQVISSLNEKRKNIALIVPLFITGFFLSLVTLGLLVILPIIYPLLLLIFGFLVELFPVPLTILMAFPLAKMTAALLLSLTLILVTSIMKKVILY